MKTLKCECGAYLGEIVKGRLKKGTTLLCSACTIKYIASKMQDSLDALKAQRGKENLSSFVSELFKNTGKK